MSTTKHCAFKLEKIVGLEHNVFRCSQCGDRVCTQSPWPPIRQCPALRSCLDIPESMQEYLSAGLNGLTIPIPCRIDKDPSGDSSKDLLFFHVRTQSGTGYGLLQVPRIAVTPEYLLGSIAQMWYEPQK
jgi:hypothetical protein